MSVKTQYWDSSVFVAYLNDEEGRADVIENLLNEATDGKLTIVTSAFACVEVLKLKDHKHLSEEDEASISEFFQYPFIKMVDATRGVCESARHLIWKHPTVKPKDAVHMASALAYAEREQLDVLCSYDNDFLDLDGSLTQKFHIKEPFVDQLPLFKETDPEATPEEPATPQDLL